MNCDVIRDLLPLYAEGLTCETTNRLIEEHLNSCEACRSLYQQSKEPPHPEPSGLVPDYRKALCSEKNRNRRKILWFSLCAALSVLLVWWGYMELHFGGRSVEVVSQNTQRILKEVPELLLTQAEQELTEQLFSMPAVQERLRYAGTEPVIVEAEDYQVIPKEEAEKMLAAFLPSGVELNEVGVLYSSVNIDYTADGIRIILEYADGDGSGRPDVIRKTLSRPKKNGDVRQVYTLTHYVGTDRIECEKTRAKHIWFGFAQ